MPKLVHELQALATSDTCSINQLLRQAKLVATKLQQHGITEWIDSELDGYRSESDNVPEYRILPCELKAYNPYNGMHIPYVFQGAPDQAELFRKTKLFQPVSELENLAQSEHQILTCTLPPAVLDTIRSWTNGRSVRMPDPKLHFSKSGLIAAINSVQNTILNWALQLEIDGVLGENFTFTPEEQEQSTTPTIVVMGNVFGQVGTNSGVVTNVSDIDDAISAVQASAISQQEKDKFQSLAESWKAAGIDDREIVSKGIKSWIADNIVALGALGVQIGTAIGG